MVSTPLPIPVAAVIGAGVGLFLGGLIGSTYLSFTAHHDMQQIDPFAIFRWTADVAGARSDRLRVALGFTAGGAIALSAFAAIWARQGKSDAYGKAHWQSAKELRDNKMLETVGKGFLCGKLARPDQRGQYVSSNAVPHVMMIAPTRAGKGVGFVIPNLLVFKGSLVVLDVKGENFEVTARRRAAMGDRVFRFAPFDWGQGTHRYNPLARIAAMKDFRRQFTEVTILADLFLEQKNDQNSTFVQAGKSIFIAACMLALQRGTATFGAVNAIISAGSDKNKLYKLYAAEADQPLVQQLWTTAAGTSEKLLSSNLQALKTAGLNQWDNPAVIDATNATDFDFNDFRSVPTSLYLVISEDHIAPLAPLIRLLFADLIATLRDHEPGPDEPLPVMIMIDEFQQLGSMPYIERAIHTLASYGGRLAMIAQSVAALDQLYGSNGRQSLETGAGLKLYITPRDYQTVKEVSSAVGSTTREAVSHSFGRSRGVLGSTGTTIRMEERPLLSETDARMMDPDEVIILASPQQPIRVSRIKYHEDPIFLALLAQSANTPLPLPPSPMLALPPPPILALPVSPEQVSGVQPEAPTPPAVSTEPGTGPAPVPHPAKDPVAGQGAQAKPKSRARRTIAPVAPPTQIVRNPNAVPVRALFDSFEDSETLNDPLPEDFASTLADTIPAVEAAIGRPLAA